MVPAIVLAGHTIGLGVIRSLGENGVPIVLVSHDPSDYAHRSKYVRETILAPDPEIDDWGYAELLIDLAHRLEGAALFPCGDPPLVAVARHRDELSRHFRVACADWLTVETFIDKGHAAILAAQTRVPAPATRIPNSKADLAEYRDLPYPCLVKPRLSHRYYDTFLRKMSVIHSPTELHAAFQEAWSAGHRVLVQEFIPGDDSRGVNYLGYWHEGEPLVEFTAQKLRSGPPSTGSPRAAVSRRIPEAMELGRQILGTAGYSGYACIEFKFDTRDSRLKFMEVNPRHNLSSRLATRCGINFPWLHYRHLVMRERPSSMNFAEGVFWVDIVRDAAFTLRHLGRERISFWDIVRPYLGPSVFADWDAADPAPFRKRLADLSFVFARRSAKLRPEAAPTRARMTL